MQQLSEPSFFSLLVWLSLIHCAVQSPGGPSRATWPPCATSAYSPLPFYFAIDFVYARATCSASCNRSLRASGVSSRWGTFGSSNSSSMPVVFFAGLLFLAKKKRTQVHVGIYLRRAGVAAVIPLIVSGLSSCTSVKVVTGEEQLLWPLQ